MGGENGLQGQLLNETIKQFLSEMEKTQWKIIKNKIGQEVKALREQLQEEKNILENLTATLKREQDLLAEISGILDAEEKCILHLTTGKQEIGKESS